MQHGKKRRSVLIAAPGVAALGVSALVGLAARPAEACTYAAFPTPDGYSDDTALDGYPDDGALGVPTDVRPIYSILALRSPDLLLAPPVAGDAELAGDSAAPESVPFELVDEAGAVTPLYLGRGGGTWFLELVPQQALAPRTRYELRLRAGAGEEAGLQLSFTTGDGALGTVPEPPSVGIQHYTLESSDLDTCGPSPHGTCLGFREPASGVYVEARLFERNAMRFDDFSYLSRRPRFFDIAGLDQPDAFDCIELRNRAPNGTLSSPVTRCREDGKRFDLRGSEDVACIATGVTQDGRLVSTLTSEITSEGSYAVTPPAEAAGCALTAPARPRASLLAAVLPALLVSIRRARRHQVASSPRER